MKKLLKDYSQKKPQNKYILMIGMTSLVVVSVMVGAIFYGEIYSPQNADTKQIIKEGELSFEEKNILLGKYSVFIELPPDSDFQEEYKTVLEDFEPLESNKGNVSFVFVEEMNDSSSAGTIILRGKYNTTELSYFNRDVIGTFICDNLHPTVRDNYDYCRIKEIFSSGADALDKELSEDEIIAILSQTEQVISRDEISYSEERVLLNNNRVVLEVHAPYSSKIFQDLIGDITQRFPTLEGYNYVYLIEEKGLDDTKVILVSRYDETEMEEYDSELIIEYICDHIPISVSNKYDICENNA